MRTPYLSIAAGGIVGSLARWLAGAAGVALFGASFPWSTLIINVAGSFAIGFIAIVTEPGARFAAKEPARQFWMTGICGGFTSFSLFSLEAFRLLHDGAISAAAAYIALSLVTWIAAAWAGERAGDALNHASSA